MNNIPVILIILAVCVVLSAFFSSSEIAFAKCNRLRMKKAAENGDKTAAKVLKISESYTGSLSTILMGNNLVNIASSSLATLLAVFYLGSGRGETVATVVMTVVLLIFGETLPKIISAAVPDATARLYARPLTFFTYLFKPIVFVVTKFVNAVSPLWTPKNTEPNVTTEELCEILDDIEEEGVFSEDESELIKSAIEFTDTLAQDILIPRVDVFAIDIDDEFDLTDEMYNHSRIPVYRSSIDNIIGILPTKKLLKEIAAGKEVNIEGLLVPPIFVHKTRTVSSIIEEFRKKHLQMAVVVDEYGGTMGILTLEDITEEVVGDIFDERDRAENDITEITENSWEVDGGTNIYDMFDFIGYDEPADFESDYTTVGGWAAEMLNKLPENGDAFTFECLKVTVLEALERRVLKLKVEKVPFEDDEV